MSKNKKKVRRKSKAAQVTAERRAQADPAPASASGARSSGPSSPGAASKVPEGVHEAIEFKGGGGVMTKMRGGFQSAVGTEGSSKKGGWLSTFMWALIILGTVFMFMGGYI